MSFIRPFIKLKMKAVIATHYGPPEVLQLTEIEKPVPGDNEVLVQIHAATVTAGDCELRQSKLPILFWIPLRLYMGILKPRVNILGQELSGVVERVGKNVTRFKTGDEVFGATDMSFGAYAEYGCLPEKYTVQKPANMSLEDAATLPLGGLNAVYFLNKANLKQGEKILINGAAGTIGVIAVQLARAHGLEVTAVDSGEKLAMLRSIGADHVVDFTKEDFAKRSERYDLIFDIAGKGTFLPGINSLKKNGRFIMGNLHPLHIIHGLWISMTSRIKVIMGAAPYTTNALLKLKELSESGKIWAVVDKRFPLEHLRDAHEYVDKGHKKGNVVITISHDEAIKN
jgi:NADPH:quinone reductase-like Zn-dependent oxidoreductase